MRDRVVVEDGGRAASYRDVFAVGEFRILFGTHLVSIAGDQLARVALAVLVFDRTGSPALAALTYALTLIPELAGGPLLAGLADRYPRRTLMITCDLIRAGLVAMMAVPGMPLWLLGVLVLAVPLAGAPYKAARAAIMPTILAGDRYEVGIGLTYAALQAGILGGYAVGAPLVAWLGPEWALLIDAATFVMAAMLVASGLGPHPPAATAGARPAALAAFPALVGLVWRDRRLRYLLAFGCLAGCYTVPIGLAVPFAAQVGVGTAAVGLLLVAHPAGCTLGAALMTRLVPPGRRLILLGPLAVATSAVLLPIGVVPGLGIAVALCALCGLLSGHDAIAVATFTRTVPVERRGQAYGLAVAVVRATQGLGAALAGVVAQFSSPSTAIAVFAALGVLAGTAVAAGWRRVRPRGATPAGSDRLTGADR
ncbi:MAG TPA: MFS transporter [Actinophytocola sp.]|uniref:MFS transporter n=1 Tax=Actinophytocola sp. TaxID=1872138 RepID=UPI002DDD15E5|nr:MFS transporter [Actinophytocola sp.]HEV2782727.1 MFS transporter [Actinophytocola sp.]